MHARTVEAAGPVAKARVGRRREVLEQVFLVVGALPPGAALAAAARLVAVPSAQDGVAVAVVPVCVWRQQEGRRHDGGRVAGGSTVQRREAQRSGRDSREMPIVANDKLPSDAARKQQEAVSLAAAAAAAASPGALVRVAQHFVGVLDLFEPLLRSLKVVLVLVCSHHTARA